MFELESQTGADCATRVLGLPKRLPRLLALQRFRPLQLGFITGQLREWGWKAQAVQLIETHFPAEAAERDLDHTDWMSIQSLFFNLVEGADWFHIDWIDNQGRESFRGYGVLDMLWEAHMNGDDYDFEMAEYLIGIPVRCYGLNEQDFELHPGLHILAGLLLHDDVILSAGELIDLELYDNLCEMTKEQLRERLRSVDFSHLPEPLCWLPEVSGVASQDTGNIILDTAQDLYEVWPCQFTWAKDVQLLREDWRRAKPVVEKLEKLVKWLAEDDMHVIEMAWAIIGSDDDE